MHEFKVFPQLRFVNMVNKKWDINIQLNIIEILSDMLHGQYVQYPARNEWSPWNLADQTLTVVHIKSKKVANSIGQHVISKLVRNINVHMCCNFHECYINSER